MTVVCTRLPQEMRPYLLRAGEGERYVFGRQVASVMASSQSTGGVFEMVVLSGGKGEEFPLHRHAKSYESVIVLEGKLEFLLNGTYHLLTAGDYVHIPPGTPHAYRMAGHRTKLASYTVPGSISAMYSILGTPYAPVEHPAKPVGAITAEQLEQASAAADIEFLAGPVLWGASSVVEGGVNPGAAAPYVLESGEGDRLLTADQLHSILASQKNTDGEYIFVSSIGPKGDPIVEHYHEHHTETFFCTKGEMTMWANGEEIRLQPGDFLHVPAGTLHSYRLNADYTQVVGLLVSGLFEPFFRTLGDPYEDHIFPSEPGPLRMDRVLSIIHELDLKVVAKSPLDRK
ncbi:quercetin 2,3-dioxygenase [Paenibacillus mucilaginosus]|uniref:QdoI n=1 Tax=Paenibacillus mucilaginosus (strain KNP414) TaxID=1036673 RepID=F8FJT2_PAEMK|nr:quercetin 2,3-dioxygenase [Paenibacillus mucilaginosus]AEI43413.1 QdoI [Paenibacillus mucilaginosus KNP414]MCG7212040.1 quercetin 2,3-dioxygenase [Paenibacillus mucilaginosus]WDM24974.1 quercetin 2,3-dioxygenase [Paenibacillus mucilaginosus]